jgi:hypothetical protein
MLRLEHADALEGDKGRSGQAGILNKTDSLSAAARRFPLRSQKRVISIMSEFSNLRTWSHGY